MTKKQPRPTIEVETFDVPCKVYGCFKKSKYKIGNMKGSPMVFFHVCEDCLNSILKSAPIENVEEEIQEQVAEEEAIEKATQEEPVGTALERLEQKLEDINYRELQEVAKKLGLNASGKTEEIKERILESYQGKFEYKGVK